MAMTIVLLAAATVYSICQAGYFLYRARKRREYSALRDRLSLYDAELPQLLRPTESRLAAWLTLRAERAGHSYGASGVIFRAVACAMALGALGFVVLGPAIALAAAAAGPL